MSDDEITMEIDQLEKKLIEDKRRLVELKHLLPPSTVTDYAFKNREGKKVPLSQLFGDKDDLIVIHNMGKGCPYCTLWADGFNGVYQHLENRAGFVVISPDDFKVQREFAKGRGWKFRMLSARGTSFFKDMGFEEEGKPWPGVSTFRREADGTLVRVAKAYFGPGDEFCAVWPLYDLLLKGADGWEPKYTYERVATLKRKPAAMAKPKVKYKGRK